MTHPEPFFLRRRPSSAAALATVTLLAVLVAAACVTPPATPSPAASAAPLGSAGPSIEPVPTTIDSAAAAAAAVLASDPRLAGLQAKDPDLIGQCCFWTATPSATGYDVTVEVGWGDCPAGCINRHQWLFRVAESGAVQLVSEVGPPVPAGVPGPADGTTGDLVGIRGTATAGPVCPVVRPDDPNCADRPVAGATVHILDETGLEVATLETDAAGSFLVGLPAGRYRVQAGAVEGLMGTPGPSDVTVGVGLAVVDLAYDTGIR